MRILVTGKNIEITPALRAHAEKKASKLERMFVRKPVEVQVTLRIERGLHISDVTMVVDGVFLRGEDRSSDMYASIESAYDKVIKQIIKHKTKLDNRLRDVGNAVTDVKEDLAPDGQTFRADVDGMEPRVVRTKKFPIKPMGTEEAIMQMELLDHDFFVYRDLATNQVNVLYKRRDGDYGLLEPED